MADNSARDLTLTHIDAILCEAARFTVAVHAASQSLRAAIYDDDATLEDVSAIDPASFEWPNPSAGSGIQPESDGGPESTEPEDSPTSETPDDPAENF